MYDFLILDLNERATVLWEKGVFIINHKQVNFSYSLYSFDGYFVEVTMDNLKNRITEIIPFRQGWKLEKYLEEISLDTLWDNITK